MKGVVEADKLESHNTLKTPFQTRFRLAWGFKEGRRLKCEHPLAPKPWTKFSYSFVVVRFSFWLRTIVMQNRSPRLVVERSRRAQGVFTKATPSHNTFFPFLYSSQKESQTTVTRWRRYGRKKKLSHLRRTPSELMRSNLSTDVAHSKRDRDKGSW